MVVLYISIILILIIHEYIYIVYNKYTYTTGICCIWAQNFCAQKFFTDRGAQTKMFGDYWSQYWAHSILPYA